MTKPTRNNPHTQASSEPQFLKEKSLFTVQHSSLFQNHGTQEACLQTVLFPYQLSPPLRKANIKTHSGNIQQEKSSTTTQQISPYRSGCLLDLPHNPYLKRSSFLNRDALGSITMCCLKNHPFQSSKGSFQSCCEVTCKVEGREN